MIDEYQVCALPAQIAHELRAASADGETVSVYLTRLDGSPNRRRGNSFFSVEVSMSWMPEMGRVLVVDARGNVKKFAYAAAAAWVGRVMPGRAVVLSVNVQDASAVSPAWTEKRAASVNAAAAAVDHVGIAAAADAKRATVELWLGGTRKTEVLSAARAMDWCVYFDAARAPGGSAGADINDGPRGGEYVP